MYFLKIFLQSDFNLENPETFEAVIPWSQLYGQGSENGPPKNSAKLLQEKVKFHYFYI